MRHAARNSEAPTDSLSGFKKTRLPFNLLVISGRKPHAYKRKKWVDLLGNGQEQKQKVGVQAPHDWTWLTDVMPAEMQTWL